MELLIGIAVMGVLLAIAAPSIVEWRKSVQYKEAADGIVSSLRTARNNAISLNRQNRVECNPAANRYRITQGNRAYNSTTWTTVKQNWTTTAAGVGLKTGTNCDVSTDGNILFNPNGTASAGKICIMDNTARKYEVTIAASGRIISAKP